jgi:hypothetical protein
MVSVAISFIAANIATRGIGAAIAALVTLVILLVTHFHMVKDAVLDVWNWIQAHKWVELFFPAMASTLAKAAGYTAVAKRRDLRRQGLAYTCPMRLPTGVLVWLP